MAKNEAKTIDSLVSDIYGVIEDGTEVSEEETTEFGTGLAALVRSRVGSGRNKEAYLRLSNLGVNCDRKLWYSIRHPELGEELKGDTLLKFLIGDVWEAVLLFLAKAAGHKVEGEQDEIDLYGLKGHRDAVIDGTVVDVKSASSRSFIKFKDGLTPDKDSFGYLTQLGGYLEAAKNDPLVTNKTEAAFLVGDKTLGKLHVDKHKLSEKDWEKFVNSKKALVENENIPPRAFQPVPEGKSGNEKLGLECSYCPFKRACFPNYRTFLYSFGPVFLTKVAREPKVPELK